MRAAMCVAATRSCFWCGEVWAARCGGDECGGDECGGEVIKIVKVDEVVANILTAKNRRWGWKDPCLHPKYYVESMSLSTPCQPAPKC